jgi:hypothetical protein
MSRLIAIVATVLVALACAAPAQAAIDIQGFATTSSNPEAGHHPDLTTSFELAEPGVQEVAKDIAFEAPQGVFGNPNAVTECSAASFATNECSPNSQIGLVTLRAKTDANPATMLGTAPIYVLSPQAGEAARLAFVAPTLNIPIAIPVSVRTATDYGLRFQVTEISQLTPLASAELTFWGFPADPANDAQRFPMGMADNPSDCPGLGDASCLKKPTSTSIPLKPLIDYPTVCTGEALVTELKVRSYQDPGHWSTAHSQYDPVTGCEHQSFNPVLSANLTTGQTDSASGLDLTFTVPQPLGKTPSQSELKAVTVTFPPGVNVNPDAADGQSACSDAQANFVTEGPAECPDNAKVGTVTLHSPALNGDLTGSLYIGEPQPGDQYRLFMVASGLGLNAKLVGSFRPDPTTGQVTGTFEGLPQVPFETFDLHLFASDRGLLATPTTCTQYPVRAKFFPWNGRLSPQISERFFSLTTGPGGGPCPGQVRSFNPRLVAGMSTALAGAFSDFHLKLDRDDGDQYLGSVNFRMPPGFTGSLRGISYCSDAAIQAAAGRLGKQEQASASCPPASLVGTTNVAAGPGSHPFHAVGKMYLAGPYHGAPLSLVTITPALAGPYDYGVVVVRVALHIDPHTAQVSAVSGEIPHIIGGIPIRMRSIQVNIDRPNFTINPTNCSAYSVDSQGIGDQGTVTDFSSYFHAVNCATLGFAPKLTVRQMGGRKQTKRNKNPALRFDLRTRAGDANLKSVAVTLPKAWAVDQTHLGNICSRAELAAKQCAGRQAIGNVEVETPLLDHPLTGPAYAVSGYGDKLPHLVFILAGQVTIMPEAESSSVHNGHLKTVVPVIPDAPVGHFRLNLFGGKQGYLINTRSLCAAPAAVKIEFDAQNGKRLIKRVKTKTPCGRAGKSKKK